MRSQTHLPGGGRRKHADGANGSAARFAPMYEARRSIAMCGALLALVTNGCGRGSGVVVAQVSDTAISKATLEHWMSVDAAVSGDPSGREARISKVLRFLISTRWLAAEGRELGIQISEREGRKQLALLEYDKLEGLVYQASPQDAELKSYLESPRAPYLDRLWLMRLSLLAMQVQRRRVSQARQEITRHEILRYYQRHRAVFFVPERRDLEILGNDSAAVVRRAKREIEAGRSFLSIAKRVTIDPEAPDGLQLGITREGEEPPFTDPVFAAKPHVLVGPLKYGFRYLFRVFRVTPDHQQTPAEAEGAIRQQLAVARASGPLAEAFTRKWAARTSCRAGYLVVACGREA